MSSLPGKKAVKIARRHVAIGGDFRHRGLAVTEMGETLLGGGDDLVFYRLVFGGFFSAIELPGPLGSSRLF